MQDHDGFMWFGTWDGLNRFDGYTFSVYKATHNGVAAQVNNRVEWIYEDPRHRIWWQTYDGHYYCLDAQRRTTTEQPAENVPTAMKNQKEEAEEKTAVDKNGIVWLADDQNGIQRYRDGQWKRFTPELDNRYAGGLREHFLLLEDSQGRTWVNPTGGGWGYYDYEHDVLVHPFEGMTNMIHTAFIDRDGQMWIATYDGGVDCVNMDPLPYQLHDLRRTDKDNGEVRAFVLRQDGKVEKLLRQKNNIYCALDSKHGLLYGTKGKGLLWQHAQGQWRSVETNHPDIYDLEEGSDGTLYVATYGGGLNILRWDDARHEWSAPEIVCEDLKIRDIEIVDNVLWCGTTNGLLRVCSTPEGTKHSFMPSYDIRTLRYCHQRLWLGTFGGGLISINPHDSVPQMTSVETYHDIILSMACNENCIWFTSERDISELNVETGNLYFYEALNGEQSTYFTEAEALCQPDGTILFGYSNGYCTFDPSLTRRSTSVPRMHITRVEVQGEPYYGDTITIPNGSNITIEYAALDYIRPDRIVYSYRMEGIDNTWQDGRHMRRVTYSNLHHGRHIFHVRSTNREGSNVVNEKCLVIYVERPMSLAWWAFLLYILLIVSVIGLIYYVTRRYNDLQRHVQVENEVTNIKLRFFTNISHELRTPLTLISAPVDNILQNERINQNVRNQLEIVQSNSRRMLRMVNQLLEFRKVQNQKMKLKIQKTLLSDLVADTCQNFMKEADDKHIHFEIINNAKDSTVWVDRGRMDTILWNLLSNAFKFTPSGKHIRVIVGDKPGFVTLAVQDEGIGIAPEKRSMLFERFSSNNELNNTGTTGTGIGMNLTKELVDQHHGFIEVDSEVGKGTTMTVLLHTGKEHFGSEVEFITEDAPAAVVTTSSFEDKIQQLEHEQGAKYTLLVVDDNQDMRHFLSSIFGKDYAVVSASDGEEAKQIIRTKDIDLVITDLMMPKVDGLELTEFIKKNPEFDAIPVILLTAKTAIESRLEALQIGADDYVTKPFEPEYMRARVKNILQQRKQLEHSYRQRLMRLEAQKGDEHMPGDDFLAKLLAIMDKHMDNNTLTVDELVDEMGMGRTVFFNRLKNLMGLSPVEFIREMRIKRAAQLLDEKRYNVTEVTYMVGMNDSRYFSKCFKNTYGVTPSEYRRKTVEENRETHEEQPAQKEESPKSKSKGRKKKSKN